MSFTAKDVMQLRKSTGLGMADCKKALEKADGDMDKAAEIVRAEFGAKMDGRADRESGEGRIAIAVADDKTKGAIVRVNTETDFTAKNDAFVAMAQKVADLALAQDHGPVTATDEMEATMKEVRLTTGENVQFGEGAVFGGAGHTVGSYVHFTGKVGVLIDIEGEAPPPGTASANTIKLWVLDLLSQYDNRLIENYNSTTKDGIQVARNKVAKGRVDAVIPLDIIELLHQFTADVRQVN